MTSLTLTSSPRNPFKGFFSFFRREKKEGYVMVKETSDYLEIRVYLPGYIRDDFQVYIRDKKLWIVALDSSAANNLRSFTKTIPLKFKYLTKQVCFYYENSELVIRIHG